MGATQFAALPVAAYGVVLLLSGLAYALLTRALVALHGQDSALARAVGRDFKGQPVAAALCPGYRGRLPGAIGGLHPVRSGGGDLAGPGPAHRHDADGAGRDATARSE